MSREIVHLNYNAGDIWTYPDFISNLPSKNILCIDESQSRITNKMTLRPTGTNILPCNIAWRRKNDRVKSFTHLPMNPDIVLNFCRL